MPTWPADMPPFAHFLNGKPYWWNYPPCIKNSDGEPISGMCEVAHWTSSPANMVSGILNGSRHIFHDLPLCSADQIRFEDFYVNDLQSAAIPFTWTNNEQVFDVRIVEGPARLTWAEKGWTDEDDFQRLADFDQYGMMGPWWVMYIGFSFTLIG